MRYIIVILSIVFAINTVNAQKNLEELQQAFKTVKTDSARGEICRKISFKYYGKDFIKCKEYSEKSLNYYKKANSKNGQGLALQMLGFVYEALGDNNKGAQASKESIRLLEEAGNYKASVVSYSGLAYCLEKDGKTDEALKWIIRSLEVIDEQKLPDGQKAKNLVDLGRIYRASNQLQKAIDTYNEALVISLEEKDHATAGILYMNIGNVYTQKEEYNKALEYHKKSLKETRTCNCAGRLSRVWSNIGFAQFQLNNAKAVQQAADSADKHLLDKADVISYSDIETLKGMAEQLKGEHLKAIPYFEKALELIRTNNFQEKIVRVSSYLGKSYAATGNIKKLEDLLITAITTKDSSYNTDMAKSIAEMEIRYETELKEQKLNKANEQNLLKEKHIKEIEIRNTGLIILVVIGLILAATSFWLMQKSRKNANELKGKNKELAKLLDQKKLLLKEIHHRVKNNLQTVSSLLNLQTRASDNQVVRKAMVEGQIRLKSISLLHQKLYQHDELTKIEMDEYVNDLARYIIKNFNNLNKTITLTTNAKGITLDLDTAIPLGLILNELITNSIKYSFSQVENGEIEITIKETEDANNYELRVTDNGEGLPQSLDIETLPSMGLKLVKSLSRQIHGSFETLVDNKAHYIVNFTETIANG